GQDAQDTTFAARFAGMPREEVAAFVDDIFAMTGIKPVGERSADEIVERLAQKGGRSGDAPLSEDIKALLIAALEIDVPLSEAGAALRALIKGAGLKGLDQVLTNFETRKDLLLGEAYQGFTDTAWFATRFGRRFTYYDGFVFELSADDSPEAQDRPFAAGGRYDALLGNLSGGNVDETAIGGIIIPHRLARIAGGAS
ncbi:MAG: ATP phosphoribosyltransferase regulatory subunit, partial [Pseudomonadota bacterium]